MVCLASGRVVCTIVGPAGEKCFMSCINSLSQADIGLSQKVMRNAKTFYHNSTIGAPGLVLHMSNNQGRTKYKKDLYLLSRNTFSILKVFHKNL